MAMPQVCLDAGDAVELGEILSFIGDWLLSDRDSLTESLGHFVGSDGYDIELHHVAGLQHANARGWDSEVLRHERVIASIDGHLRRLKTQP